MIRSFWKSWAFLFFIAGLIFWAAWAWHRREGLIWAVPVVLSINYFLLIHSRQRIVPKAPERDLEGNDGWNLTTALHRLCKKAHVPVPRVIILESPTPQAFLLGRTKSGSTLFLTDGFLHRLDSPEREAILALNVAVLKLRLQFKFYILGAFMDMVFGLIAGMDRLISWTIGTSRTRNQITLWLVWPILYAVQRWSLSSQDYFQLDQEAATLCSEPEALCQALLKMESSSLTQPIQAHPAWTHVFAVGPWTAKGPMAYLQPQPSAKSRIKHLQGSFPL